MIIAKLNGGLGNQMFQYAAGKRLATKNNTELKLDLNEYQNSDYRTYRLNNFNIAENIASQEEIDNFKKLNTIQKLIEKFKPDGKRKVITYKSYEFEEKILNLKGGFYLDGYWQNEKYFFDISDIIRREFVLKNPLSQNAKILFEKITNNNSVSIHIRRGDYITNKKFSKIYKQLDNYYFQNAVKKIKEFVEDPFLLVFSDNALWTKNNISLSVPYLLVSDYKLEDYEELYLMSRCQHNIISNSTFSWWGAWLNNNPNKIIIGPKAWFNFSNDDQGIMPEKWIKL